MAEGSASDKTRTITVQTLARVEGEGSLTIRIRDGQVDDVQLSIYEPPRFFEGFLRGRSALEAPDITARICGICPVAYQMSSVHAIEKIFGITMSPTLRAMRRLLYCGEWIESHTLHIYMLHAPDFLNFESALAMAQSSKELTELVRRGLRIKKAGNRIVQVLGGREIHPINVRIGGFYRAPSKAELNSLIDELKTGRDEAIETVRWAAKLPFPDLTQPYEFVSLRHDLEYPMNEGRLVSSEGVDIAAEQFLDHFQEYHAPHSTALYSRKQNSQANDGAYLVGPMARWNLNADKAPELVRQVANDTGITFPCRNPYISIVTRSLEVVLAFDEALRLISEYEPPSVPSLAFETGAGIGHAITEAPRGILYHRYETDAAGEIRDALIVPPTSQNQRQIEHDLKSVAKDLVHLPDAEAARRAENVIRNYDPCISCATHFLKFKVERQ